MDKARNLIDNIPKDIPPDQPVFMLNLLNFYEQAQYPPGSKHSPCSGQQAWVTRYAKEFHRQSVESSGGWEVVYMGLPATNIVGEEGEKWDAVVLMRYKDIGTFRWALSNEDYVITALEHRDAALKDWKLIATSQFVITEDMFKE